MSYGCWVLPDLSNQEYLHSMGSLSSKIGKEFFGAHSATQGTLTGLLNQFSQLGLNCQQGGGQRWHMWHACLMDMGQALGYHQNMEWWPANLSWHVRPQAIDVWNFDVSPGGLGTWCLPIPQEIPSFSRTTRTSTIPWVTASTASATSPCFPSSLVDVDQVLRFVLLLGNGGSMASCSMESVHAHTHTWSQMSLLSPLSI